ncbi:hypothetical protein LguiA_018880 [Lonicera macranthoides]
MELDDFDKAEIFSFQLHNSTITPVKLAMELDDFYGGKSNNLNRVRQFLLLHTIFAVVLIYLRCKKLDIERPSLSSSKRSPVNSPERIPESGPGPNSSSSKLFSMPPLPPRPIKKFYYDSHGPGGLRFASNSLLDPNSTSNLTDNVFLNRNKEDRVLMVRRVNLPGFKGSSYGDHRVKETCFNHQWILHSSIALRV